MNRWRVFLALYLIGIFRTTLFLTILFKIQDLTIFGSGKTSDRVYDYQIYLSIISILLEILIIIILYRLSNIEPNKHLTDFRDKKFINEISLYSLAHLFGYITLAMGILLIHNIIGETAAEDVYNDILSIFGLIDIGIRNLGIFEDNKFKYLIATIFNGAALTIFPMLVLMTSNMLHKRNKSIESKSLYPIK